LASYTERDGRWRALVRKAGHTKCATFDTKAAAQTWARTIERELDELKSTGVMQPRGVTLAHLVDRYIEELYPAKRWGRSKAADLAFLRKHLGHHLVSKITSFLLTEFFRARQRDGAGPVVISSQVGYLVTVLRISRDVWHLDVPLKAAEATRLALSTTGALGKGKKRDRRVSDAEVAELLAYFREQQSTVPMVDIVKFCLATGMRISEVSRLQWRDFDRDAKTIMVRDRKHPSEKIGNNQLVPLLSATGFDALEIILRQPKTEPRIFPYNHRTVSSYFTDAVKEVQLDDLHLHDLRHEAISRLFAAGYRIEEVALVSGHRDWAMLKRYTHVRAADLHKVRRGA
jgi:integrase